MVVVLWRVGVVRAQIWTFVERCLCFDRMRDLSGFVRILASFIVVVTL